MHYMENKLQMNYFNKSNYILIGNKDKLSKKINKLYTIFAQNDCFQ